MKPIFKFTILFVVIFMATLAAHAQVWYGGEIVTEIRVPLNPDGWEPEPISFFADGYLDCCYKWSGDYIVGQDNYQRVTVQPKFGKKTIYTVNIACLDGESTASVAVYCESFEIESVTPKYNCFNAGDRIKISDYVIVTKPLGYEKYVVISLQGGVHDYYPINNSTKIRKSTIGFKIDDAYYAGPQPVIPYYIEVDVVNSAVKTSQKYYFEDLCTNSSISSLRARCQAVSMVRKAANELWHDLNIKFSKELGGKLEMEIDPDYEETLDSKYLCCYDKDPQLNTEAADANITASIKFEFSTNFAVLKLKAGDDNIAELGFKLGFSVAFGWAKNIIEECISPEKSCFDVSITTARIGDFHAGLSLPGFNILSTSVEVRPEIEGTAEVCYKPEVDFKRKSLCFDLKIEGKITTFSYFEMKGIDFSLAEELTGGKWCPWKQ